MFGKLAAAVSLTAFVLFALSSPSMAQKRPDRTACVPRNPFLATVAAVSDAATLELADGRSVRLAALEAPAFRGRDALLAEIRGRMLTFSLLLPQADRYGRILAQAFDTENRALRSIDAELLARGAAFLGTARLSLLDPPCRAALLVAESMARRERLGLWGDPDYDTKAADNTTAILAAKGRFAIVEGKVLSVRDSGGTVYVNFGRRWSEDFTVTILKRMAAKFVTAGIDPRRLEGRRVRVRGFVEERGGPWIEATAPEQIELADER